VPCVSVSPYFQDSCRFFLFNFLSLSVTQIVLHLVPGRIMGAELTRVWNEMGVAYSKYYPRVFLEGLRKTRSFLVRIDVQDSRRASPRYKFEARISTDTNSRHASPRYKFEACISQIQIRGTHLPDTVIDLEHKFSTLVLHF
jgi:hypothetical protein